MGLLPGEILIDDSVDAGLIFSPTVDGEQKGHGGVPRDYSVQPAAMFDPPSRIQPFPQSEWSDRIKQKAASKSQISDVLKRQGIPSLDQGRVGYCWAHSTTGAVQASRAVNHLPYVPLSAYAVAATIKQGRDEGGWCGLSAQFAREKGIPAQSVWPQGDRNYRQHDTPATWASAALHTVTQDLADLTSHVADQNLPFDLVITCLLCGIPVAVDFNWWSHSVMACDAVEVEPGSFGIRIRNSWGDGWGDKGFSVIRGGKAHPDGAIAFLVTTASDT